MKMNNLVGCLSVILAVVTFSSIVAAMSSAAINSKRTSSTFSLQDISSLDPNDLLPHEQISDSDVFLPPQPSNFHVIDECVKITLDDGVYHFKSRGGDKVCGLYLVSDPDQTIEIHFDYVNVRCSQKGLISVVDGWELNGEVFPSLEDHEKPSSERFHDLCTESSKSQQHLRKTFTTSQNAALIQYRVPTAGQGFSLRVRHVHNPRPCNILVQDMEAVYKMENFGRRVNCSLTTLFDAKIRVMYMSTGVRGSQVKYPSRIHAISGIYHKCEKMGLEDYVQIGGSSGLDTSKMQLIEEFCGYQPHPMGRVTTVICGMTTLRMVSSGKYHNKIMAQVTRADFDLDNANYLCDITDI